MPLDDDPLSRLLLDSDGVLLELMLDALLEGVDGVEGVEGVEGVLELDP